MANEHLKNTISRLKNQFMKEKRSENFGITLDAITIAGFRGISDKITVKFDFPITAISGLNGAGKSTIAQLTVCAFRKLEAESKQDSLDKKNRYYIKDFFPISTLDNPVFDTAKVEYSYSLVGVVNDEKSEKTEVVNDEKSEKTEVVNDEKSEKTEVVNDEKSEKTEVVNDEKSEKTEVVNDEKSEKTKKQQDLKTQQVTVTRSKDKNWSGYKRQPQKQSFYIGFLVYLPKIEKKDFTITGKPNDHKILSSTQLSDDVTLKMATIIGYPYSSASFETIAVNNSSRSTELAKVERLGKSYSENNMGFGEGRTLYIVNTLEAAPDKSFFVIEEPETALHEEAQFRFTQYLIDVCDRKKHQIILSTHSRVITNTLPPEARKLIRNEDGICSVTDSVSSCQISSVLSQQPELLVICVEDIFAKELLTEVIRKIKKEILPTVIIYEFGSKQSVVEAVTVLQKIGRDVIAVRDADTGVDKKKRLLSLPVINKKDENSNLGVPPEKDVFSSYSVRQFFKDKFNQDINFLFQTNQSDHHNFALHIGEKIHKPKEVVRALAIDAYLSDESILDKHRNLVSDIESFIK